MAYRVKELFHTLQGEGARAGTSAVFCRFTGCNLWTGREEHRASAICQFCDTDFVGTDGPGGGVFAGPEALADAVASCWKAATGVDAKDSPALVVCTGGEPLLQLDVAAIDALHAVGLEVAIETNGTKAVPPGVDWVCMSPKAGTDLVVTSGDELKLIYPQLGADPEMFEHLDFTHFLLQPMDGPEVAANTATAVEYCKAHPRWRLSLQTHKWLGIP